MVSSVQHYWGGSCFAGVGAALLRMGAALLRMDRALLRVDAALLRVDASLLRMDAARLILSISQLCAPAAEPTTGASIQYSCSPGCFGTKSPIHCKPGTAAAPLGTTHSLCTHCRGKWKLLLSGRGQTEPVCSMKL